MSRFLLVLVGAFFVAAASPNRAAPPPIDNKDFQAGLLSLLLRTDKSANMPVGDITKKVIEPSLAKYCRLTEKEKESYLVLETAALTEAGYRNAMRSLLSDCSMRVYLEEKNAHVRYRVTYRGPSKSGTREVARYSEGSNELVLEVRGDARRLPPAR